VPDGTVYAVDDQTGEVACGFDGELIEVEAAWDSAAVASLKCADCEQVLASRAGQEPSRRRPGGGYGLEDTRGGGPTAP
jgi:hypothetical protein